MSDHPSRKNTLLFPLYLVVSMSLLSILLPSAWATSVQASPAEKEVAIIDLDLERELVTRVSTQWKFHPGNDPAWAFASFDDHDWKSLNPLRNWDAQGYTTDGGQAWFRFRVRTRPGTAGLVLQMPRMAKNYQLFVNGQQIAQTGAMPPGRGSLVTGAARVFTLPAPTSGLLTVALRVWRPSEFAFASPDILSAPVLIGASTALLPQFARSRAWSLVQRSGTEYTSTLIQLPIMAAALLLFFFTRERFYLWFGLNMCIAVFSLATHLLASHFAWDFRATLAANILWDFAAGSTLALFLGGYLRLRDRRLVWLSILSLALGELGPILVPFYLPALPADIIYFVFVTISDLLLVALVLRAWRSGVVEAALFLVPFALGAGVSSLTNFGYILLELQIPGIERWLPGQIFLFETPFPFNLMDLSNILALFGFLAILVFRFARTIREQQRLSTALRAAHEIQARLVPESNELYPNLKTEVVYLAAEEVGGDFCQVLPREDGTLVAVIGDVSGKGLQAAMIGALAVGALRSLVHGVSDPAVVLERMNEVMLRSDLQGFVTCLCVAITPAGQMTMASAGHPPPYINGVEALCEPGLPLGIAREAVYKQNVENLPPEARLTLLSDGVLEARSPRGELFGFSRMEGISEQPARQIAAAAQSFGQQDDITVMTLDWHASLVPA